MCVCSQVILDSSQKTTFLHNFSPSVPHAWPYQAWSNFTREDAESPWQLCIRRKKDKTQAFILIRLFSWEASLYKSPGFGSDNVDSQRAQLQVLGSVQGKGLGLTRAVKCLCLSCRLGVIMAFCCALISDYLIFFFSLMPVMPTLYFPLWIWTWRWLNNCQIRFDLAVLASPRFGSRWVLGSFWRKVYPSWYRSQAPFGISHTPTTFRAGASFLKQLWASLEKCWNRKKQISWSSTHPSRGDSGGNGDG